MKEEHLSLISNHAVMARSNQELLERVLEHPEGFKRSDIPFESIEYGPMKFQCLPTFFNRDFTDRAQLAAAQVCGLIKSLPRRIFALDAEKIADFYEIAPGTAEYLLTGYNDRHVDAILGRGDFLPCDNGFKCLEFNLGSKLGGWEQHLWRSVYQNNREFVGFLRERGIVLRLYDTLTLMIEHMVNFTIQELGNDCRPLHCAVVMPEGDYGKDQNLQNEIIKQLYRMVLMKKDPSLTGELFLCPDISLESRGDSLYFGDNRISLVVELNHGMIPIDLYNAYVKGHVVMFNGPLTWIMSNKLNLALLSDPEYSGFFDSGEQEIIHRYIPWTRKTEDKTTEYKGQTIDLYEFVYAHKDLFVLKPADGVAGFGISVGRATERSKWEQAVDTAFKEKKWVVQEYVDALNFLYQSRTNGMEPHRMVWGFFLFGDKYSGCLLRLMETRGKGEIINSHQGAEVSVVFEIEEQET
jgi:hypothetical protein